LGAPHGNRNAAGPHKRGFSRSKIAKMKRATPFKNPKLYRSYTKYMQKKRRSSRIA